MIEVSDVLSIPHHCSTATDRWLDTAALKFPIDGSAAAGCYYSHKLQCGFLAVALILLTLLTHSIMQSMQDYG